MYIGSHKGTPDDGYICSSKLMMEEYHIRPCDFLREILVFGEYQYIRDMEARYLTNVNAGKDPQYYNQSNGSKEFYCKGHHEKTRKRLSDTHMGELNHMFGKTRTDDEKKRMGFPKKGKPHTKEHNIKIGNSVRGLKRTPEQREHYKQAAIDRWAKRKSI